MQNYEISPSNITINPGEKIQLHVIFTNENGEQEKIKNVTWNEIGDGGHIDSDGILYAMNAGSYIIQATIIDPESINNNKTIEINYCIVDKQQEKSWNEKLREARLKALNDISKKMVKESTKAIKNQINKVDPTSIYFILSIFSCIAIGCISILLSIEFSYSMIIYTSIFSSIFLFCFYKMKKEKEIENSTLKKVVDDFDFNRPKKGFFSMTRAFFRTAGSNTDIVWCIFLVIFCVSLGCCSMLLISGISLEKVLFFISSFIATIISAFGKIYSPPGEITQAIQDKMIGASDDEKIKNLQKKKEEIDQKIKGITTKQRHINNGFFKFSIDERSQPIKE